MYKSTSVLLAGKESEDRIRLLLQLTDISSEDVQDALVMHMKIGASASVACVSYGVAPPNFSRALKRLNEVAGIVESIKEIDWKLFPEKLSGKR